MALVSYDATLNEWENIIRVKLKVVNPTLLKSGALGILTNYLAGIKYDSLQFYSKAFQEMNIGLAQDFNSMLYHSTIYGTELEFATPSTLSSSIVVPEINLALISELIYTIPRFTPFTDNNGLNFLYISEIKITITAGTLRATSWNPQQGTRKLTVTKAPNPNIPGSNVFLIHNSDVQQYYRDITSYVVPEYSIGDTYSFSTGVNDVTEIKDVYAWVNEGEHLDQFQMEALKLMDPDNIEGAFEEDGAVITKIEIKFYKFDSSFRDAHLFLEIYESNLTFETGDGIHGTIMPAGSQLLIELDTTLGIQGNIANSEYILTDIGINERYADSTVDRSYTTSINGLSATGSYGGKNIQEIDGIRENIFNQINIRDSIITENDYERLFKYQDIKPFVDAKFLDAKAFVFLFNVIHENDQIVPSTSVNYKEASLFEHPFYPTYSYGGEDLISPFYYKNSGVNDIDAYIVNPSVLFTLNPTSSSPNQSTIADYRVDLALTYEFQVSQTGMNGKSYIEIIGDVNPAYIYQVYTSWLGNGAYITLSSANQFKYEINTLYTDPFCIVRENSSDILLQVYEAPDIVSSISNELVAEFEDPNTYHQLIKKQTFYKYFKELPIDSPLPTTTRDTLGYLDNFTNNIMSTASNAIELNQEYNTETFLLRLPFISEPWFSSKNSTEVYEIMNDYFIVNYIEEDINYNTQLTQAFHNTIDIPPEYYPFIFEETTMPVIDNPNLPISIEIFVNQDTFVTSKYGSVSDLEIAIKIVVIKYLKGKEGFMVDFFETDLEKEIYNTFSPLIRNVKANSPTMFRVNNSATIYSGIQENLTFEETLNFIPPYFYYDYNNLELKITM